LREFQDFNFFSIFWPFFESQWLEKNQIRSIILRLFCIGTFGCMREFHAK